MNVSDTGLLRCGEDDELLLVAQLEVSDSDDKPLDMGAEVSGAYHIWQSSGQHEQRGDAMVAAGRHGRPRRRPVPVLGRLPPRLPLFATWLPTPRALSSGT